MLVSQLYWSTENVDYVQGSHSSWKILKNDSSFSSHGNIIEFDIVKYRGKMGRKLENEIFSHYHYTFLSL